jgi:hypothetical protein
VTPPSESETLQSREAHVAPLGVDPPVKQPGPPVSVYRLAVDGLTDPTGGQNEPEPSVFNALSGAFGAAAPPAGALLSSRATFGGAPGTGVDFTENQVSGTVELQCVFFEYQSATGSCPAALGATRKGQDVHEFGAVQSWPFYVGDGASSNLIPGAYTFETTSDDGSWLVLAPAAATFAQPGDFQGTSGLVAGTAAVDNGYVQGATSRSGTIAIGAQSCAASLYWLTFEYFEVLGGGASMEYSWMVPGTSALQQATQAVVWGRVTRGGAPVAGQAVSVASGGNSQALTTDSGGCYGYNLVPAQGALHVAVTVVDDGKSSTHRTSVAEGAVKELDIALK